MTVTLQPLLPIFPGEHVHETSRAGQATSNKPSYIDHHRKATSWHPVSYSLRKCHLGWVVGSNPYLQFGTGQLTLLTEGQFRVFITTMATDADSYSSCGYLHLWCPCCLQDATRENITLQTTSDQRVPNLGECAQIVAWKMLYPTGCIKVNK